jgi:hypothetical protein
MEDVQATRVSGHKDEARSRIRQRTSTMKSGRTITTLEQMAFYPSMSEVQRNTGLDIRTLLLFQVGFSATPAHCACGYEWNAFDLILKSVKEGLHDWAFYQHARHGPEAGSTEPGTYTFGSGPMPELTCPKCQKTSGAIVATYYYCGYIYPRPTPET